MIFAIKPFEIHDGDGIRTTVFFKGCSLRCRWCHNPESFLPSPQLAFYAEKCQNCLQCTTICDAHKVVDGNHRFEREQCKACGRCVSVCPAEALLLHGKDISPEDLAKQLLKDKLFMQSSGGGVTLSGGEPLLQADFCRELILLLKKQNINSVIDTCGAVPKASFEKVLGLADGFLFDIKAIDEQTHIRCTGVSNRQILENLHFLDAQGQNLEIRYPYIPSWNDGEVDRIAEFVSSLSSVRRLRVLGYHDLAVGKYASLGLPYPLTDTPVPSKEEIQAVIARMQALGVNAMSSDD